MSKMCNNGHHHWKTCWSRNRKLHMYLKVLVQLKLALSRLSIRPKLNFEMGIYYIGITNVGLWVRILVRKIIIRMGIESETDILNIGLGIEIDI